MLGPVDRAATGRSDADSLLLALEGQGRILRGRFTPGDAELEWCDRRLLARIHRYTLSRLRAEIEPVSAADYMRFLLHWQHVAGEDQVHGAEGLAAVVEQLEGFELAAAAWEHDVLPARVADYGAEQLDSLCLSGRVAWGRLTPGTKAPLRTSPIALLLREHASPLGRRSSGRGVRARSLRSAGGARGAARSAAPPSSTSWSTATGLLPAFVERGLAELAGAGVATADSFAGLRALLAPPGQAPRALIETAGRWSLLRLRRRRATIVESASPARSSSATASSSARCCSARRSCRRGATWCASTAASKRAARSAAGASSPASAASSSPRPMPSGGCARCARWRRSASSWC